jgi:hypothetical protein
MVNFQTTAALPPPGVDRGYTPQVRVVDHSIGLGPRHFYG